MGTCEMEAGRFLFRFFVYVCGGAAGDWEVGCGDLGDLYGVLSDASKIVQASRLPARDPRSGSPSRLDLLHGKLQMETSPLRKMEFQPSKGDGDGRVARGWLGDGYKRASG